MKALTQYINESKGFDPNTINFDDNYVYVTDFKLKIPVSDKQRAKDYLLEDDMTYILQDDITYYYKHKQNYRDVTLDADFSDEVVAIFWNLRAKQTGEIVLVTTEALTDDQLTFVSDWVHGQCSDGLGESFEQVFGDDKHMASFDWKTNDYKFKEVRNYKFR